MERDEDTIDLSKLFGIMKEKKKIVGCIVGGCTVLAMAVSFMLPKEYTSNVLVQTSSTKELSLSGGMAALAAMTGGSGIANKTTSYIELMKTRTVLEPIIEQVFDDMDEEKRPDSEKFAKKNLDITNAKGTNLISIDAKGRTPEEAHYIAENVVGNFLSLMTETSQGSNSEMMKFLNNRVGIAKKEADEAAKKMEEYSKEHNVYVPDEQTKVMLAQSAAFDKTIGELQVQKKAAQAQYESIAAQIGGQNENAKIYNLVDNEVVEKIREQIINKEIHLVELRQKYQEQHPDVIRAVEELSALHQTLNREVAAVVDSESATVNSVQAGLLAQCYQAATAAAVAEVSEDKVRALQAEQENGIKDLADSALEYMKMEREAKIKAGVYTALVQQAEQTRIQQTMESMDIQVIDPASMPKEDKPSGPRKKLITAIGFVLGCMISFGYSLVIYKREN